MSTDSPANWRTEWTTNEPAIWAAQFAAIYATDNGSFWSTHQSTIRAAHWSANTPSHRSAIGTGKSDKSESDFNFKLKLKGLCSVLVASCVTWGGAADSSGLLLPYPITSLA